MHLIMPELTSWSWSVLTGFHYHSNETPGESGEPPWGFWNHKMRTSTKQSVRKAPVTRTLCKEGFQGVFLGGLTS